MYARQKKNPLKADEKGFVVVLVAATLILVISMTALVVDAGIVFAGRADLARGVDSGALAGAQDLPADPSAAAAVATDYVNMNTTRGLYAPAVVNITFPLSNAIQVESTMQMPAMFSRIFGYSDLDVAATAVATRYAPDVALIIDRSASMCRDSHGPQYICPTPGPWEPFNTVQDAAKGFVDALAGGAGSGQMALISYSTTATLDVPMTSNDALIKTAIDSLVPSGYTDIAASVDQAINELLLLLGQNPKIIVLLTDGIPNVVNGNYVGPNDPGPADNLNQAADDAKEQGFSIYSISYGNSADLDLMDGIAETTEGASYHAPDAASLSQAYGAIADTAHIRLTYVD